MAVTLPELVCDPWEVDRLYDAGKAVPDSDAQVASWTSRSQAAREGLPHLPDQAYGPTRAEYLDIFPGPAGGPVHVFIHGGYWRRFSAKDFSFVAEALVAAGHTVVVPNYALCPQVTIAEIVRQMRAALRWVVLNGEIHGGDVGRLTISGHSAGGHLVGMMLATDWSAWREMPARPVQAAVALSGIYDLAPLASSWLQPVLQLGHHQIRNLSPARHVRADGPPLLLAVGERESSAFHAQADRFAAAWTGRGNPMQRLTCPDRDHFTILAELPGLLERVISK